ncbi:hypothetical protein [Bdellovibrio sp. BCCA]|uniref:hypothetical protein n=1 Tax=Bdellovibrio sp. BCCA TaxID=3136281 RepID=UPI0030F12163
MRSCFIIVMILLGFTVQAAAAGWDHGNAGDTVASEFILSGRDVLQRLELLFENNKPVFDATNLRAAIMTTEVVSEDHVMLDGFERDAVNYYPTKRLIKVNRSRWTDLRRSTETKARLRLVLHEYLWISGVDDTNFIHSEHLIELLNINNYSPSIWWNPVNPANYVKAQLTFAPEGCTIQPGKLDVKLSEETLIMETAGNCQDSYRQVQIVKQAGVTPPSSNARGLFHKYEITVLDRTKTLKGEMIFEPEWGACLLPEKGVCQVSGKMTIGGVELVFWFLRN